jgi:hypothetical protein
MNNIRLCTEFTRSVTLCYFHERSELSSFSFPISFFMSPLIEQKVVLLKVGLMVVQ